MLPVIQLDNKGLYTFANLLSQVPPGAMTIAQNIVIDRPGIAETRRGFDFYGTALTSYALKGFVYNNTLLWYCHGGQLAYDSDNAGTWINYSGSYYPPTNSFINSTQASGNFYFTTNNGVYRLDSLTGTPRKAGGPQALDVTTTLGVTGTGTAIVTNSQVAYAIVWGYTDANNNLVLGSPSMWAYVINSSGSPQNITVVTTIPAEVTTSYFVQVYRTAGTSGSSIPPGNTFQLAIQYTPNSTDITNKYVTITDAVPDSLLGAYLYTADGQPANFPNDPPPLCLDICTYNGMTFYLNYQTIQQANITMDGVGSPNGIQINDTITITDLGTLTAYTYTGKAANNFASRQFAVYSGGTIAQNIDATARNLTSAINQDPGNTRWYAYYQTGTNVLPGGIILKARNLQSGQFFINSSRTTCWTPVLPVSGQSYISDDFADPSGFIPSKVNQPDAVPLAYATPVQSGNVSVVLYRGLALQDALYLFTSAGVFRVTGTDPTGLQVILFDSSADLVGLQSPQILNNSIYYYSTQGICNVSSGGNQIGSRNIERDILSLSVLANFSSLAYGCSYESDRKYFLFSPTTETDSIPTQSYVYNWITTCWTQWTRPASAGIVNPGNQHLFIADGSGNIFKERKNFNVTDYADESYAVTITGVGASTITLSDSSDVSIGDIIQETVSSIQYTTQVTGNDTMTGILNVESTTGFANGSATVYKSIVQKIKYAPLTCGFAEYLKRFNFWQFAFSNANFQDITATFTSDMYQVPETALLTTKYAGGWGTGSWGTLPWGLSTIPEQVIPCGPSKNTAIARWVIVELDLSQAFTSLALDGVMCTFDILSPRGR